VLRSNRRPAEQGPPLPVLPSPSSSAAYATPVCRATSPGSPPSVPSGSASSFGLGSPWSGSAPGAELDPAPLRLGVSSGEQVFIDPQNRDAVLVARRGMQMPSGLRTTTAYTVDVQLANGLCYSVRFRFSRFERLHAELLRELPGVPLPPLPQKRGPPGAGLRRAVLAASQLTTRASWGWYSRLWVEGAAMRLTAQWEAEARPPATVVDPSAAYHIPTPGLWTLASGSPSSVTRRATRVRSSGGPPRSTATCAR
jgi:hypothetical protein